MIKKVDVQAIIGRVNEFISTPVAAWDRVKSESFTERELFEKFYAPAVVISAVCAFIGNALLGPVPLMGGILGMLFQIVMGLVSPFIIYFLIDFFLPKFGGAASRNDIFKFIIFPSLVMCAGLAGNILPPVTLLNIIRIVLSLAAALYGVYLYWIGTPIMLNISTDERPRFFVAFVGIIIVTSVALSYIPEKLLG